MTRLESASPVLCTRDLPAALERYARLGFTVWAYEDGEDYGYARRDGVWLHLTRVADLDPATTLVSAYLYVEDADALYAEWSAAGAGGRLHTPEDTPYGLREGAFVDPDGNLLRFGSPLPGTTSPVPDEAVRHSTA